MRNGPLETFSVFKFENNLKTLKGMLSKSFLNPLATIKQKLKMNATFTSKPTRDFLPPKGSRPVLKRRVSDTEYQVIVLPHMHLSVFEPDCFIMARKTVMRIVQITIRASGDDDSIRLVCSPYRMHSAYCVSLNDNENTSKYSVEFESSRIGIFRLDSVVADGPVERSKRGLRVVKPRPDDEELELVSISSIQTKYVVNKFGNSLSAHPIINF